MDLVALKKQIQNGKLDHFYIFCGPEIGLQNLYINQMAKGIPARADSIASIWSKISGQNKLFKNNMKFVYAIRDDIDFIKDEKAWPKVDKIKTGTVVLLVTEVDKRSKFYKHFKDIIIPFNHMTTAQLLPTVKKMIGGVDADIKYFIESCNNDYNTILNELDKCKRLGEKVMSVELSNKLIPRVEEANVFKMVDHLIQKDCKTTLTELGQLLDQGQNEIGILGVIATKLQQCVLVEGYRGEKDIAKATSLNGWVCKDILKHNKLAPGSLLQALRLVQKFDNGIKTGMYEPSIAVQNCIIEILSLD